MQSVVRKLDNSQRVGNKPHFEMKNDLTGKFTRETADPGICTRSIVTQLRFNMLHSLSRSKHNLMTSR